MAFDKIPFLKHPNTSEAQSASYFTLAGTISSWIGAASFFIAGAQTSTWQFIAMGSTGSILGLVLLIANILNNTGRTRLATWVSIIASALCFTIFAMLTSNMSVVLAFLMVTLAVNVSIQIFHDSTESTLGVIASILCSILIVLTGSADFGIERIEMAAWLQEVFITICGLVGMLLSINTLRRFEFSSLRSQIVAAFLIMSIIPIILIQASQYINIQNSLRDQGNQDLKENAWNIANGVERALTDIQRDVSTTAKLPVLKQLLTGSDDVVPNALATLDAIRSQNKYIISFGVLDINGLNILDTQLNLKGANESFSSYFLASSTSSQAYITDCYYDTIGDKSYLFISLPIIDLDENSTIGILRAKVDGQILQDTIVSLAPSIGADHAIMLVTDQQVILGHSLDSSLNFKTLSLLRDSIVKSLKNSKQIPENATPESLNINLVRIADALKTLNQKPFFETNIIPGQPIDQMATGVWMTEKPWMVVVTRDLDAITAPINAQVINTSIIVFVVILAVIGGASITASFITSPINELVSTTKLFGEGSIGLRIRSNRKDEIGTLADTFDNTTGQIERLLTSLEDRVNERTRELTDMNQGNEKRAHQLRAVAEVAQAVTTLQDLEELLPLICERISDTFGFYHVGIFLIDQSGVFAILQASNSEGGRKMLERRHRLRVGQVGIVGYVTSTGHPRIALDVGDDAIYFNNPDLPLTRSEMALPLKIGEKVIGALDVQSTEAAAFTENDINILSLLSDQISVAIQNAQLFDETRQALAETRALYSASVKEGWKIITQARASGYRYANGKVDAAFGKLPSPSFSGETLEIPVTSRGETFGRIKIRMPANLAESTSEEELQLYESIAERLALALDNARLVEESQRRADLERAIARMSGEIGASTNIDGILQTTVEQIGQLVKNAEVIIQISPNTFEKQ